MQNKISVIVPIYNIENYVQSCIESILAQTYTNFELLLIDDGSTDNSGNICEEYALKDSRIKVFHKSNGGLTSARNYGLEHASGEWITHIDGDDWIAPNMFEILLKTAVKDKADIVFCDFYFAYLDSIKTHKTYNWQKQGFDGLADFIISPWTTLWGSIQKRSLYIDNNLLSPEEIKYCEDFHLITRLCYYSLKISKVEEALYYYRQQSNSIMHNLNSSTMQDELWVYSDIIDFFKGQSVYERNILRAMSWRALKASQDLVLSENTIEKFINYHPEKKSFIKDCPFIGKKLKIIMWLTTHNIKWGVVSLIRLRKLMGR